MTESAACEGFPGDAADVGSSDGSNAVNLTDTPGEDFGARWLPVE